LEDTTGEAWVNLFHEQAVEILGISAEDLHSIRERDPAAYERRIKVGPRSGARCPVPLNVDLTYPHSSSVCNSVHPVPLNVH
jgi:hypothetical protein